MRIFVTGGAGYIGSHAVRSLLERGHEVRVYDVLDRGHRAAVPAEYLVVGDIRDPKAVKTSLAEFRPDAVMHFAALTYVGESVKDPATYYSNNLAGSLVLLDACREVGVKRFVFSSTAAVYGVPEKVPIDESSPLRPINPYGRTKLAIEWALEDYAAAHGVAAACLRYFNAAGAHPSGEIGEDHTPESHLVPLVLLAAMGKRPAIEIFGTDYPTPDGSCIRDYIHVVDLADAHALALDAVTPGECLKLNLGLGRGYSVREVVAVAEKVTGLEVPVVLGARRAGDPPILVAAADRARELLGWKPKFATLEDIVSTAWTWHRNHPNGYHSPSVSTRVV